MAINQMRFKHIGEVESSYTKPLIPYDYGFFCKLKSRLHISCEYVACLEGLKKGKLIDVLYLLDRSDPKNLKLNGIHRRGIRSNPPTGLFNTRSPNRINPIALSTVRILNIENNIIEVAGLDAFNKSPIIDIKIHRPIRV
jgi:tRNA (adenine37-N6)-methyltransferase